MRLLILHGWGGSDAPHWQAELASEAARGYGCVCFPLLDNPHFPSKNRWLKQVRAVLGEFKPDTVVCHSLGCSLWLWLAREKIEGIERLFFVSPPDKQTKLDTIKSFFPIDLPESLQAASSKIILSSNDPYITVEEGRKLADQYSMQIDIIKKAGHINCDSGYGKWSWIEEQVLGVQNDIEY